jgi:hypothetical protein
MVGNNRHHSARGGVGEQPRSMLANNGLGHVTLICLGCGRHKFPSSYNAVFTPGMHGRRENAGKDRSENTQLHLLRPASKRKRLTHWAARESQRRLRPATIL